MSKFLLAIEIAGRLLPYVVRVIALIEQISRDKKVQARLRARALDLAFEAAEATVARIEAELQKENV